MATTRNEFRWNAKRKMWDRIAELVDASKAAWRPKDRKALVDIWVRDDPATVLRVAANIVETAGMEARNDGEAWLTAEAVTDMLRKMADRADVQEGVAS